MALPTKAELLAIFEHLPDEVVIVDVGNDSITAANAAARARFGIAIGSSPADTSFEGEYLSLSSVAAAGLRAALVDQRVSFRGASLTVSTVELATESESTVAVIFRDRSDADAALAEQSIRTRLELARSFGLGLVTRLLDPCVVLTADLEFIEESDDAAERAAAIQETRAALEVLTRTVTALRELALPDEASDAAPIAAAFEAAVALVGPELREYARLTVDIAPDAAASSSRPLVALILFHTLWWLGERLRAESRAGAQMRVAASSDSAHVTIVIEFAAAPLLSFDGNAAASVLQSMVGSAGGRVMEGAGEEGAWMRIQLPAASSRSPGRRAPSGEVLVSASVAPRVERTSSLPPGQRYRLLLVDDDDSIRAALARLLRGDYDVVTASNAEAALEAIETSMPDVIVSDVAMPGSDGPSLMRSAVARWPSLARRFLFLTGGSIEPAAQRAMFEARVPCLLKPVGRAELLDAVAERLGSSR